MAEANYAVYMYMVYMYMEGLLLYIWQSQALITVIHMISVC